ncbi:hypothetical protein [Mesorhizobium sp. 1B3]|uniref:hypothetical protein n=1 Tax=Mesorhizobium sp. 1B3 TaxID=3243599 RepID=UPI003D96403C
MQRDRNNFIRPIVDLRDFPQPLVEVEDEEALDFVTSLIASAQTSTPKLVLPFSECSRGDVFEFCIVLAAAVAANGRSPDAKPNRAKLDYAVITPNLLAQAGRAVLDWPEGLHRLADSARSTSDARAGFFGIKKELGSLLNVPYGPSLTSNIKTEFRAVLYDNMQRSAERANLVRRVETRFDADFLTCDQAAKEFGMSRHVVQRLSRDPRLTVLRAHGTQKSPALLKRHEIASIVALRRQLCSSATIERASGIPIIALQGLLDIGLLEMETGLAKSIAGRGIHFCPGSFEALRERVGEKVEQASAPIHLVRITNAVNQIGYHLGNPWPAILSAILEGRLSIWRMRSGKSLMSSLGIEHIGAIADLAPAFAAWSVGADAEAHLTQQEAAVLIGSTDFVVSELIKMGFLPIAPRRADVQAFTENYVLPAEARWMMGGKASLELRPLQLHKRLSLWGLSLEGSGKHGTYIWRRAALASLLSSTESPVLGAPNHILLADIEISST